MHPDELELDAALVGRLIAAQFPQWAALPLARVPSAGTDNAMFRLGDDLVVRLPRVSWSAGHVELEQRWLPWLAPQLPLEIPAPVGRGVPGEGFPAAWSVYRWLDGANALDAPVADLCATAVRLGEFLVALRGADPAGGPPSNRGGPLSTRDDAVRRSVHDLDADGTIDGRLAIEAWESALALPQWNRAPCWLHSDLMAGNLLTRDGELAAVIDFGILGIGDPACDLMPAWNLFDGPSRDAFRAAADVDDATWGRGRGWALWFGLGAEHEYRVRNPTLAAIGRRSMFEAMADFQRTG